MTDYIDIGKVKQELVFFLRNNDIFTIAQRGVTTTTATGTWTSATSHSLAVTNVKNIRSITVGGTPITYGKDWQVNTNYDSGGGVIASNITFTVAQSGVYIITYDYGATDKIYPDFPKPDLTISSFPRIGTDIISLNTLAGGFGNVNVSTIEFMIYVYDTKTLSLASYISAIRKAVVDNQKTFYYMGKVVKPIAIGPVLKSPRELGKDKIFQQNIDIRGTFQYEKN